IDVIAARARRRKISGEPQGLEPVERDPVREGLVLQEGGGVGGGGQGLQHRGHADRHDGERHQHLDQGEPSGRFHVPPWLLAIGFCTMSPSWFSSSVMLRPAAARSTVMLKEDRSPLEKIITCGVKECRLESESESESEPEPGSESELESDGVTGLRCNGGFVCDFESESGLGGGCRFSLRTIGRASTTSLKWRPLGNVRSRSA